MEKKQELMLNFFVDDSADAKIKAKKLLRKMIDMIADSDFEEMQRLYKQVKNIKYSGQGYMEEIGNLDEEKSMIFNVGYVYATIDAMQSYIEKNSAENEIHKVKTKYRDEIFRILAKRGTMFHKDLAAAIRVSPSGLNAVIKQINATSVKLISVEEISKFKLYSLTPIAYQYIVKHNIDNYLLAKKESDKYAYDYCVYVKSSYKESALKQKENIEVSEEWNKEKKKISDFSQSRPWVMSMGMENTRRVVV